MDGRQTVDHPAWPVRAVLLAALGACFGLAFDSLIDGPRPGMSTDSPIRIAGAAFLAVSGVAFAFSLERRRWLWSLAFAAGSGLVAAFVAFWNGSPDQWGAGEGWQFFAAVLAAAIAVPLFQSIRDGGRGRPEAAVVHGHVWTNLILGGAACAFVAATILLALLLSELFHLIGIDVLRDLMDEGWFMWPLACGAFGGAVGLLRDRDPVLGTLQKVARAVLSVLAPVLALGLSLFVLALPFTGLQPLWDQTQATTPILLACIVGAVILANAVVGNDPEEEARSPALRYAAVALALVIPPLAFVAAVSTGKRIGQYGLTPDRMWACVFVFAAAAFALAYLHALVRGRRGGWPEAVRRANIVLAAGLCLIALFLALPIVSFGAISARDQLARLESGKVAPDRFDWAAMRFDFGPAGRRALERLAASPNLVVRQRARHALGAADRWAMGPQERIGPERSARPPLDLRPEGAAAIPPTLADLIGRSGQCYDQVCRVVFLEPKRAALLRPSCRHCAIYLFDGRPDGTWVQRLPAPPVAAATLPLPDTARGRVEVRKVERQQLFVDGKPVGDAFE
ncbi:MAG TPA: DUF4153 domain-containing protein [Allosphingosinicella sp.]|nr:DUF4153 domain-containing protein [Allosphingosinicella sp.]